MYSLDHRAAVKACMDWPPLRFESGTPFWRHREYETPEYRGSSLHEDPWMHMVYLLTTSGVVTYTELLDGMWTHEAVELYRFVADIKEREEREHQRAMEGEERGAPAPF